MPKNYQAPPFLTGGVMSGTNTIYSLILDLAWFDYGTIQVDWTGTPTGVMTVWGSNDRTIFEALTFDPVLDQPAGSAAGIGIVLKQLPFRYWMLSYTNATGSGVMNAPTFVKDLG